MLFNKKLSIYYNIENDRIIFLIAYSWYVYTYILLLN